MQITTQSCFVEAQESGEGNHKPLIDDSECEQKQKPLNLKPSKAYNIQQNHENIKNRSQIF